MELTDSQKIGLQKTIEWWNSPTRKQVWHISGAAGTGKSTLVYALIDNISLDMAEVAFATYTGKAALVLTLKKCKATTIHKLIYNLEVEIRNKLDSEGKEIIDPKTNKPITEEKLVFVKKEALPNNIKLIVIDECSMLGEEIYTDLLSYNIPIIILGDKYQLGPINDAHINLPDPDVELTEIMRQKEGDPIIYLATRARNGLSIEDGAYGKCYVVDRSNIDDDLYTGSIACNTILSNANIVLCRTNRSREALNTHIRKKIYGITKSLPTMGDKIICRKNNWEKALTLTEGDLANQYINLVNGLIGYVHSPITTEDVNMDISSMYVDFMPEISKSDFFQHLPISVLPFISVEEKNKKLMEYIQWKHFSEKGDKCNLFEYAYAITVHLSQGSSWKKVVIYDEKYGDDYYNSLYTAITRAEKQVIIFKDHSRKSMQFYGNFNKKKKVK